MQKLKFQLNNISIQKCRAFRHFQSNSTPAEYHRATILISEINSRVHRVIKEAKDAKFATLLKEVTSKRSTTYCDASLGKRTVVTIPEDLPLNSAEHSVLSKGLTFVPTVNKTDEYQVKADSEKFFHRLRLKAHFHDSKDEHHEGENHHDPFTKFDNKTSTWTPPDGKFSALDHYIDRCHRSIAFRNYTKRPNFTNLTQEERTALQDLRQRNDIIIKPADKGGAVVVWKRPIVSACCCPTENISAYLDEVMAPLVKQLPTYVKDTNHALSIFNSFTVDESDQRPCFLFTMDDKSLYTVIPNDGGLQALTFFFDQRTVKEPSTHTLVCLAELVLTLNAFSFDNQHYCQIGGVAMGSRMGPNYVCLFVGYI